MMDNLDGFQKLVSTDRKISISIGLDCPDPQAYFLPYLSNPSYLSSWLCYCMTYLSYNSFLSKLFKLSARLALLVFPDLLIKLI